MSGAEEVYQAVPGVEVIRVGSTTSRGDTAALDKAIAKAIVDEGHTMLGAEANFLRRQMGMEPWPLSRLLGVEDGAVRMWEGSAAEIDGSTDRLMRLLYLEHIDTEGKVLQRLADWGYQECWDREVMRFRKEGEQWVRI